MGRPRVYDGTAAGRMRAFRARRAAERASAVATRCMEMTTNKYQCRRTVKVYDWDGGRCWQHDRLMRHASCMYEGFDREGVDPYWRKADRGPCRYDHGDETHDEWRKRIRDTRTVIDHLPAFDPPSLDAILRDTL